jgi:hypothetical protein
LLYFSNVNESQRSKPVRDSHVTAALRSLHDQRVEAERAIALWERSQKPYPTE